MESTELPKKDRFIVYGVSDKCAAAVHYYMFEGLSQRDACEKAGLSRESRKDVFHHPLVEKAIEQYKMDNPEPPTEEKQALIDFYRKVINAPYNTPVNEIHPPKGFKSDWVGSVTTEEKWTPVRQGSVEPPQLTYRVVKYRNISESDRINAAKELSILLGLREEKMKVDNGDDLMKAVQKRRQELSGEVV